AKPVAKAASRPAARTAALSKQASTGSAAKKGAQATATARAPTPRVQGKVAVAVTSKAPAPAAKPKFKVVPYKTDPETGRPIVPEGYKPDAQEEYMNPLQLEYFRQKLLARREELVEESRQTIENL